MPGMVHVYMLGHEPLQRADYIHLGRLSITYDLILITISFIAGWGGVLRS